MTDEERWAEIEECFNSIALDIEHRCYPDKSITGAKYVALLVKRNLIRIDQLLVEYLAQRNKE